MIRLVLSLTAILTFLLLQVHPLLAEERPNILWITSEDNSPDYIGPYGNPHANTPTLDKLATEGVVYEPAYANAAVCAPARTVLITGTYPPTLGGEHMRSQVPIPGNMKIYPQYLRDYLPQPK